MERELYYTRSIEEILGKFHGMTQFTIANFNKWFLDGGATPQIQKIDNNGIGHWKVPVDKTSNGFHHVHRMCSSENFNAIFLSMPGVTGIADDMIIFEKLTRNMMEIS